jgi:hypothetical protein
MSIASALHGFVDDELSRSAGLIDHMLDAVVAAQRDDGSGDRAPSESRRQFELAETLHRHGELFRTRFIESLREGVQRALRPQEQPGSTPGAASFVGLELVDEARVEVDIEISRAEQIIDSTAQWELRELQTFTSTLCGLQHVSAESNPLRPVLDATALWDAACSVAASQAIRAALLRMTSGVMAGLLKSAWAAASSRLYRSVLLEPAAVPDAGGAAPVLPAGAGAEGPTAERLSRLFTLIQGDTLVPSQVRAVLSRLQVAAMRVALHEPAMLESADHPVRASASIRRFVTGAWAKVLAESMVRFGEHAEPTPSYMKTVDELLRSLQTPDHPQSRQRLIALLPDMLQRLRSGMALIALPAAEEQAVLDELMVLHAKALRTGQRGVATALPAEEIVRRMREEVIPDTPALPALGDSVIDLASMQAVPAGLLAPDAGVPAEAGNRVDALTPGERLRLFVRGGWVPVQLLWRSDKGLFFLFAGVQPGATHSIMRRALERLDAAGLMKPLEDGPIVQRGFDVLANPLSLPA